LSLGYIGYVIAICSFTGALILLTDVRAYKNATMKKEQKVSLFLGWINISIGFAIMLGNWIYQHLIW
jgi:hypothetical protein